MVSKTKSRQTKADKKNNIKAPRASWSSLPHEVKEIVIKEYMYECTFAAGKRKNVDALALHLIRIGYAFGQELCSPVLERLRSDLATGRVTREMILCRTFARCHPVVAVHACNIARVRSWTQEGAEMTIDALKRLRELRLLKQDRDQEFAVHALRHRFAG